jgi:gas vesicle protein
MQHKAFLVSALLVLPAVSFAQRGGGTRSQANQRTELMDKDTPKGPSLRVRDVEDMSPIRRLIDKHKDVKLSDAQVDQLKESQKKLEQKNEPLMKAVDSLLHEIKQAAFSANDAGQAKGRQATMALRGVLVQIQDNDDAAATEATASFDAEQKEKAKEVLGKLKEDNEKMLKERLSTADR